MSIQGNTKGVPLLSKMVYKRVGHRGGASPIKTLLSTLLLLLLPPPPRPRGATRELCPEQSKLKTTVNFVEMCLMP